MINQKQFILQTNTTGKQVTTHGLVASESIDVRYLMFWSEDIYLP